MVLLFSKRLDDCISYTAKDHPPYPFDWDDLSAWNFGEWQERLAPSMWYSRYIAVLALAILLPRWGGK
jgi:hypothetical protein